MYSTSIKPKVETMFNELKIKTNDIITESRTAKEAIDKITKLVNSELATRSKSILSDMLFDLSDKLMETDNFSEVSKQNKFFELNLRQEILNKYQFTASSTVDYSEASKTINALITGGATFVIGGAIEVGTVLVSGLSMTSLIPIPIGVLIVASIGAALYEFYAIEPKKSKKSMTIAVEKYLDVTKEQFLNWFDEVEKYFDKRVEEIKKIL